MTVQRFFGKSIPTQVHLLSLLIATLSVILFSTGCGTSPTSQNSQQTFTGNTNVTMLLTSTANDQVTLFDVGLQTLTLNTQSGKAVTVLSSRQPVEFMHLNGRIEPLTTVSVPQGIYTSAQATLSGGLFVCIGQVPGGGLGIQNYSVVNQGPTVTFASPITITGNSMALLLNMQVSSSATLPSNCWTTSPLPGSPWPRPSASLHLLCHPLLRTREMAC